MGLLLSDDEWEKADYLHDQRREERAEERQAELFAKPMEPDTYTLLRLFENYRGIDVPQGWLDLLQRYHSDFEEPGKLPKTSWRPERLRRALNNAEAAGFIVLQRNHDWAISDKGLEARKAETVRRMQA